MRVDSFRLTRDVFRVAVEDVRDEVPLPVVARHAATGASRIGYGRNSTNRASPFAHRSVASMRSASYSARRYTLMDSLPSSW